MNKINIKQYSLFLTPELFAALEAESKLTGISIANILRRAATIYLQEVALLRLENKEWEKEGKTQ